MNEIPFQRIVPKGFYEVEEEKEKAEDMKIDKNFHSFYLEQLEEKRRTDEESKLREKDKKKFKKLLKMNTPSVIKKISKEMDPLLIHKRSSLLLPSPQLSDNELQDLAKISDNINNNLELIGNTDDNNNATKMLLNDYNKQKQISTPMRTPKVGNKEDVILQEARNLIRLNSAETPLLVFIFHCHFIYLKIK